MMTSNCSKKSSTPNLGQGLRGDHRQRRGLGPDRQSASSRAVSLGPENMGITFESDSEEIPMSGLAGPDPLRNAYGVVDFEILADPKQPRVRAVHIETGDGRTFTFAIDARTAMALASALI